MPVTVVKGQPLTKDYQLLLKLGHGLHGPMYHRVWAW